MDTCKPAVCVTVDGPETACALVPWAVANVVQPSDELVLLHVDMKAVRRSWMLAGLCRTQDTDADDAASTPEQICEATVHAAEAAGMDPHHVHARVLPSLGSRAQTAGAAVQQFVEGDARNRLLVVGTRGMGAIKRADMSMVGLGSVSSCLVQNTTLAVAVVGPRAAEPPQIPDAQRQVLVAIDASVQARGVLDWALDHLLGDTDRLHVICVAEPPPPPVYDEMGVHSIMLDAYIEDLLAATETAWGVARSGANIARERPGPWHTRLVICKALDPVWSLTPDTASGVADAITRYADDNQIDLLVVGRRGQGLGATIRNWTGLGSVSSHLMGNAHCPVIVTHPDEEPQQ